MAVKILIVEDEAIIAHDVKMSIENLGYRAQGPFLSAEEAIAFLEDRSQPEPDLVLMDIVLKGDMDGIDAAMAINQRFTIPVIFLTAYLDTKRFERAKSSEPFGYVIKPFEDEQLLTAIETALYRHRLEQRIERLNRLLRSVRTIDQLIVHEKDIQRLLQESCSILANVHEYQLVWIARENGWTSPEPTTGADADFYAGEYDALVDHINDSWSTPTANTAQCPILSAAKNHEEVVVNEVAVTPAAPAWYARALEYDIYACATFPLLANDSLHGVLVVFSNARDRFDEEEAALLSELADDIAFAVQARLDARKHASAVDALRESEAKFRHFFENAQVGIVRSKFETGEILEANATFASILGMASPSDLVGRSFGSFLVEPAQRDAIKQELRTGDPVVAKETRIRRPDGAIRWLEGSAWTTNDGATIETVFVDITKRKKAEEELREKEEQLSSIFASSPNAIGVTDLDGTLLKCNDQLIQLLGFGSKSAIMGRSALEFFHEADRDRAYRTMERALETGIVRDEFQLLHDDGSSIIVELAASLVHDADGNPRWFVGILKNIEQQKRMMEELDRLRKEWEEIFHAIGQPAVILGSDQSIRVANTVLTEAIGLSRDELRGQKCYEVLHHRDQPPEGCPFIALLGSGEFETKVMPVEALNGYFLVSCTPVFDENGVLEKVIHIATDVTERRRAELALQKSEKRYRLLAETAQDLIVTHDMEGHILYLNPAARAFLGDVRGENLTALLPPSEYRAMKERSAKRLEGDTERYRYETAFIAADGSVVPIEVSSSPLEIGDVQSGVLIVARDISARKAAKRQTQQYIEELVAVSSSVASLNTCTSDAAVYRLVGQTISELNPASIILIYSLEPDDDGLILERQFLSEASDMGRDGEEAAIDAGALPAELRLAHERILVSCSLSTLSTLIGKSTLDHLSRSTPDAFEVLLDEVLGSAADTAIEQYEIETQGFFVDHRPYGLLFAFTPQGASLHHRAAVETLINHASVVIHRLLAEERRRTSEEGYRRLVEHAPVGIASIEPDGTIIEVNERLVKIFELASLEVAKQLNLLRYRSLVETGVAANIRKCFVTGTPSLQEGELRTEGGTSKHLLYHLNPVPAEKATADGGTVDHLILIVEDITASDETKQELRTLEARMIQQEKLRSVGTLAGGVAHEINNPLNIIMNYAQLIHDTIDQLAVGVEEDGAEDTDSRTRDRALLKRFSQEIIQESYRVVDIVKNLLSFSRQNEAREKLASIANIVDRALMMVGEQLRRDDVIIETELSDDLPRIHCRPRQIQQLIMNLLLNAHDALNRRFPEPHPEKLVTVHAKVTERTDERVFRLMVEDHGCGIPPSICDRVFDPFFTTNSRSLSRGLGLAVVHGIVAMHDGSITIESEPDAFTRIVVDLPLR